MGTRDRWQALIVQVTAHLALVLYPRELRQGIVVAVVNLLTAVQVLNVPRVPASVGATTASAALILVCVAVMQVFAIIAVAVANRTASMWISVDRGNA